MGSIWSSFIAFNQNGLSHFGYTLLNNLWYLLIAAGAIICIVLYLKEEIMVTVKEEQQIL